MLKYLDLILGISVCVYIVSINIALGKIAFSEFILAGGIIVILYHFLKYKINDIEILIVPMKMIKMSTLIGVIIFIVVQVIILAFPKDDLSNSDYAIVLGAGLRGETLSLTLKNRLDSAIKYSNISKNNMIVVSGGQGPGESITEALAMKLYLVKKGIDQNKIIIEDESTSTSENLIFSKEKIEKHSYKSIKDLKIKIITTDFHALRSHILAKRYEYKNVSLYTSRTLKTIAPVMYTREFFALIKSIIFD